MMKYGIKMKYGLMQRIGWGVIGIGYDMVGRSRGGKIEYGMPGG